MDSAQYWRRRYELLQHAFDRLNLCPDHRDKATGVCVVCQAETRTRRMMEDEYEERQSHRHADQTAAPHL